MKSRATCLLLLAGALAACEGDRAAPTAPANPAATTSASQQQPGDVLLTLVTSPRLSAQQSARLARIAARSTTASVAVARLHAAPESILQSGRTVALQLAPALEIAATGRRVTSRASRNLSWSAAVEGERGTVDLVLTQLGATASIRAGGMLYRVEPIGDGLHAVTKLGVPPAEHPSGNPSGVSVEPTETFQMAPVSPSGGTPRPTFGPQPTAMAGVLTTIDMVVAYTPAVASAVYDVPGLVQLAIDESNTSYANSGISIQLRAVYTGQVSYSESGRTYTQHVNSLQSTSDGIMDVVHSWRNTYKADVVSLLVNDPAYCGQAYTIYADAAGAFDVVHYDCATGYYSFAHELGHLQGARHDRYVDGTNTPFQYGHGYVDPNHVWRTIMAYGDACGGCQRVQYWSSPNVYYPPTGQVMGTATYEDNARVLNETRTRVANFRSSLTASWTGPQYYVGHSSTCTWTANVSGGTPPYSYGWSSYWSGSNMGFYFTGGQDVQTTTTYAYNYNSYPSSAPVRVSLSGTDAAGESYYVEKTIQLYNTSMGCY